ncbi:hypothetical protein PIB30_077471 [Stylosanthes scabra]|uniref:RNase H type-1 domain-containing protein n=1 Tax=Stylosanthes scabra TaxID=79078 RepID=A0ABU6XNI6_9FABA|nr:hypothetical protein [Stylosanthes scabra]
MDNTIKFSATLLWIWRNRNNDIFNSDHPWNETKIQILVSSSCKDFLTSFHSQKGAATPSLLQDWIVPSLSCYKVNCDASFMTAIGNGGFGCVICDWMGKCVKGCSRTLPMSSVTRGELHVIWRGLVLAWKTCLKEIVCESDCLEVAKVAAKNTSTYVEWFEPSIEVSVLIKKDMGFESIDSPE